MRKGVSRRGIYFGYTKDSVSKIVTDTGTPPRIVADLRARGIEVIVAPDVESEDQ